MRRRSTDLNDEVAEIGSLSRTELAARWQAVHGHPPPKGIRHELLVRSATWHLQAKRLGGMSTETRRLLRSAISRAESDVLAPDKRAMRERHHQHKAEAVDIAGAGRSRSPSAASAPRLRRQLAPGARLIREWNGRTHVVDVIEGGFVFQAKVHRSLTAIARQITGAHWSGPRFFGL